MSKLSKIIKTTIKEAIIVIKLIAQLFRLFIYVYQRMDCYEL